MDLTAIIVSAIAALSGISAWSIFWLKLKRGSSEKKADHALEKAKEVDERIDRLQELVMDHRVIAVRDIAVIKTLVEANSSQLASAERRLAGALDGVTDRLEKFNERIDRLLETRKLEGR